MPPAKHEPMPDTPPPAMAPLPETALAAGSTVRIVDDAPASDDTPTCHYCQAPMVQHLGGPKDGCWHAAGGCCFLPGRRELRPGHPPCDTYAAAHPEPTP